MNPDEEALARVIDALDRLAVPYMVTGSVARSYHGRPRATHHADVVIDPTRDQIERLAGELERIGFYMDGRHLVEARVGPSERRFRASAS